MPQGWTHKALRWWVRCLIAFGAFFLHDPAEAGAAIAITDARTGIHDGATRVVLEVNDLVDFNVFTLADPYRVVIDISDAVWRASEDAEETGRGVLERIRHGVFRPGILRVVLDCAVPTAVNDVFLLKPLGGRGYRLVVDLAATGHDVFLQTARLGAMRAVPQVRSAAAYGPPPRRPSRVPAQRVIVLDPGHGGDDPGAIGLSGVYEKEITLRVARAVRDELRRLGGYKVVLTREKDRLIRLRDRVAVARKSDADLFLSIHADAMPDSAVRGASVYTLSETASDDEAATLAEQENKVDLIAGVDLSHENAEVTTILIDLAQRETMNQSARFASVLIGELSRAGKLLRNTHRFAGFAVLKAPDVPAVLVELGFLSNRTDEKMLRQTGYQTRLAAAIAGAIHDYFTQVEEARRY